MTISRRQFTAGLAGGTLAVTLGAGSLFAQGRQKVRIGLPTRVYWPSMPVHVAQDLKLYDKENLDAEITIYNSGGAAMEALAAGAADIIVNAPANVAFARQKGVKAVIVAAGMQTPAGWYLLVKEGSPIRSLKHLDGKKLGITSPGSLSDYLALWAIDKGGIKVTKVPVGGGGLVPNLLNGQLDAVVIYPPLAYSLLVSKEARVLVDFGKEMEPTVPDTWVASEAAVTNRPEVVEATLRAIFGGLQYMKKNRGYAVKFIQTFAQLTPEVSVMEYEKTLLPLSDDGVIKREWMANSMRMTRLGGATSVPPLNELYTDRFAPLKRVTTP